jgi:hypothetical protein
MSPPRRGRGLKHEMRDAADTLNLSALSKDASEFRHVYNANSYTDPLDLGTHTDDIRKMMEAINIQLLYYTQEWGADIVSSSKTGHTAEPWRPSISILLQMLSGAIERRIYEMN